MFAGFSRFVKPVPWQRCEGEFWAWWIHEKDDVSVSDTGGSEEKIRVLVIGVERMTFWLPVSVASLVFCSSVVERRDTALPLSYRRLGLVWFVAGKTRDIALQLVWRQCCKQVALFVALFILALDTMYSFKYQHFQVPVWSGMVDGDWCSGYSTTESLSILFFLFEICQSKTSISRFQLQGSKLTF